MRTRTFSAILLLCVGFPATRAQYGSVNAKAVSAARAMTLLVVLDDGDSPYNRAITEAVKAHWTFSGNPEFIHAHDLAVAPLMPDKTYLLKTTLENPDHQPMTFVTVMQGWKQKKGEVLEGTNAGFKNIPGDQVLASIQCDPEVLAAQQATAMYAVYVKHLQDYLKNVESGKIIDKATADRLYQGRNRLLRDQMKLWIAKDHLDRSLPDAEAVKANYTHEVQVLDRARIMEAVSNQDHEVAVTDLILTGDNKNKHCYKRVFNAGTGELMYLRDDAALFGKKEGFINEDFKQVDRAR